MPNWSDDKQLMRDLKEALEAGAAVTKQSREAAHAAFTWRTVDSELEELLALAHDSQLADAVALRSATATEPRVLSFDGSAFGLEVEVTGEDVMGQVVPGRAGRITLRSAAGPSVTAEADDGGFFTLSGAPQGSVRFEVDLDGTRHATQWLLL